MGRSLLARCAECGGKLPTWYTRLCPRCLFDLTGEDDSRPHPWEPWPEMEPEE